MHISEVVNLTFILAESTSIMNVSSMCEENNLKEKAI